LEMVASVHVVRGAERQPAMELRNLW